MRNHLAFSTVEKRISRAIREFLDADADLLANDVAELAIAHRFTAVLATKIPGRNVDANYNRHGVEVKRLLLPEQCRNGQAENARVLPDVVVHLRQTDAANVLVVEIKKSTNRESRKCDIEKLRGFRREFHYQYGLFLEFEARTANPRLLRMEWFGKPRR